MPGSLGTERNSGHFLGESGVKKKEKAEMKRYLKLTTEDGHEINIDLQ